MTTTPWNADSYSQDQTVWGDTLHIENMQRSTTAVLQRTWNRSTSTLMRPCCSTCRLRYLLTHHRWRARPSCVADHYHDYVDQSRRKARPQSCRTPLAEIRPNWASTDFYRPSQHLPEIAKQPALNTIDPRSRKLAATCASSMISQIHSLAERWIEI